VTKPILPIFFCWEKTMSGQWAPVCYHGRVSPIVQAERSPTYEVPPKFIDIDGSPRFGALMRAYPAPQALPLALQETSSTQSEAGHAELEA
jgi:hypothetical protein